MYLELAAASDAGPAWLPVLVNRSVWIALRNLLAVALSTCSGWHCSQPITDKETVSGEGKSVEYGVSSMQGWRRTMEDGELPLPQPLLCGQRAAFRAGLSNLWCSY